MTLDLLAPVALAFAHLKTDAGGAAVRAALGAGAASVIDADALDLPLPLDPFIVWRDGPVAGRSDDMRGVIGAWWAYDAPDRGQRRIKAVLGLVEASYPLFLIPYGRLRLGPIGQAAPDPALGGRWGQSIQLTYLRRA